MCETMNDLDLLANFSQLLQTHDWFYNYTDDYSVWLKGNEEQEKLMKMYKLFSPDYAKKVWNAYAPEPFKKD